MAMKMFSLCRILGIEIQCYNGALAVTYCVAHNMLSWGRHYQIRFVSFKVYCLQMTSVLLVARGDRPIGRLHSLKRHTCVIDRCVHRMIFNFAPLGLSCWYSTPVKDGVLRKRGFQAFCAKVCFLVFLLGFYSHSLSTLAAKDLLSVYWNRYPVKNL
jgi:hypothetical protein